MSSTQRKQIDKITLKGSTKYRPQYLEDSDNEEGCTSPSVWVCQEAFRPFFSKPKTTEPTKKHIKTNVVRNHTSKNTSTNSSDEDVSNCSPKNNKNSVAKQPLKIPSGAGSPVIPNIDNRMNTPSNKRLGIAQHNMSSQVSCTSDITDNTSIPAYSKSHHQQMNSNIKACINLNRLIEPVLGDSRIVAPHVSKLSPISVIEVQLISASECVLVLCSVDVLKMRSGFFHDLLSQQEQYQSQHQGQHPQSVTSPVPALASLLPDNITPVHAMVHSTPSRSHMGTASPVAGAGSDGWRESIRISEESPFEAAAFLESLHEGRQLFKGEWNLCWARLSCAWLVDDLILEYAAQVESHTTALLQVIEKNHWRTSPAVLCGMKIAVFRKGHCSTPTVAIGTVIESPASSAYSRVRVAFESCDYNYTPSAYAAPAISIGSPFSQPVARSNPYNQICHSPVSKYNDYVNTSSSVHNTASSISRGGAGAGAGGGGDSQAFVGDVAEPFWVRDSAKESSSWMEPDDLFLSECRKLVTQTDKREFWEMVRAIIELPQLAKHCKMPFAMPQNIVSVLRKVENRVLWTPEAAHILPQDITAALLSAAYVLPDNK